MSVLHTESFIAFGAVASNDDTSTTANNAARQAAGAALARAGYQIRGGSNSNQNATTTLNDGLNGWMIRPDPVNPERNALFASLSTFSVQQNVLAIRKALPIVTGEPIIGGFSLFIPNEFTKATVASTNPILRVQATATSDALWYGSGGDTNAQFREVFRISQDLQVRWGAEAAQSQKVLVPGRLSYIEYRISPSDVRVWIDDVLVLQKIISLNVENIGINIEQFTGATGMPSNPTLASMRWSIGNWYNLVEDLVAPNVRLGPTTRVIGVRPDQDVSAMFQRPSGYASNAAVVAQNLVDAPAASLQSVSVGDQDVYRSTNDVSTASGKMIHAVNVKVLASNLEANPHSIRPLIRAADGTESPTPRAREWRATDVISTRNILGIARRPTDGKIFAVGATGCFFVNRSEGAPGTPWITLQEGGGAFDNTCIAFRADGWGVVGRSDGRFQLIPPTQEDLLPSMGITNINGFSTAFVLPNGRFLLAGIQARYIFSPLPGTDPTVVGNWGARLLGDDQGEIKQFAFAPSLNGGNGRLFAITARTSGYPNSLRTDAWTDLAGGSWTHVYNAQNTDHRAVTWDSKVNRFIVFALLTWQSVRISQDGAVWTSPPATNNNFGLVGGYVNHAIYDTDAGYTVAVGDNGGIMVTPNASEFRPVSRVTDKNLRSILKLPNGDYLAAGFSGQLVHYTAGTQNGYMAPLGGYVQYNNFAAVNPVTGAAWTPADASASQFGMRLTS